MRVHPRKVLLLALSTWLMFIGPSPSSALAEGRHDVASGIRMAGSFLTQLHLTGTDGTPFTIQALATLSADGGAIATDTDDYGFGTGSFFHSPKHGAWKRIGVRAISITLLEFAYDPLGNLTTIYKLNFQGEFSDQRLDVGGGTVTFEAFLPHQDPLDPEEQPVATGEGTFSVQRIKA
jgi:hypothetical protein